MTNTLQDRTAKRYLDRKYEALTTNPPEAGTIQDILDAGWWSVQRQFGQMWAAHAESEGIKAATLIEAATEHVQRKHERQFESLSQDLRRDDAKILLSRLAQEHSFMWLDIARMLGVSVPAIRKWRMSGGVSPENHAKLANLVAFANILSQHGIRPASWMSTPFVLGYTVAPKHLYQPQSAPALLDIALEGQDAKVLLDQLQPLWRTKFDARGYADVKFDDGNYGLISTRD